MTRTRTTPYTAQLDRLLNDADGHTGCFSALTLADEFEHPRKQKPTTTLSGIHKALFRAWGAGKLISFIDADSGVLREESFGAPGSAAVEHPQIFARTGTPSPKPGYEPATYEQYSASRHDAGAEDGRDDEEHDDDGLDHDADASDDVDQIEEEPLTLEHVADVIGMDAARSLPPPVFDGLTVDSLDMVVLISKIGAWRPDELPPEWIPDEVLRRWVTLAKVLPHWRTGLDQAGPGERARLIRLGVGRKGPIAEDSLTARGLAHLVRTDLFHWKNVADLALAQYAASGEMVAVNELTDLASDPVEYYLDNEVPGHVVLLIGLALELDGPALQEIAADIAEGSDGRAPSAEEQLRFQLSGREGEISDLRAQWRDAQREAKTARKEQQALAAQLDRLRDADQRAGNADEELAAERERARDALGRVAELEAAVEALTEDAARAKDLDIEVRALEALRDELLADAPSVDRERRLREQAEAEVQTQLRRVRDLTQQLHDVSEQRLQVPVEDGPALITALAGPVAAAAQHALSRMAGRASLPGDAQLLRFASTFAALSDDMPATIFEPATQAGMTAHAGATEVPAAPADTTNAASVDSTNAASVDFTNGASGAIEEPSGATATPAAPAEEHSTDAPAEQPAANGDDDETAPDNDLQELAPRRRARRPAMPFTVRPIGGASEVGGSAILVQTRNGASVLLDAGQRVKGEFGAESINQFHFGVPAVEGLDAILISHAHIDHIGSLPLIHQHHSELRGSAVPVVMSEPTKVLGEIMLNDSAKIQHARERTLSSLAESDYGEGAMEPAYDFPDVTTCLDPAHLLLAEQHKPIPIEGTSLVARFLPVSHVLGSCAIHLKDTETGATLLYSGDLGPISDPQLTLPDFGGTGMIEGADVIIMESTYGLLRDEEREGRRRASHGRERATRILADIATKTIGDGGHVLLPAFSLGRTQELAMLIDRERGSSMPDGKIYVAGMGETITEKYADFDRPRGGWRRPGEFPTLTSVRKWLSGGNTFEDVVAEVLESPPAYIIASPAMISSGWSRAFMHAMLDDPRHAIVFTGYLPKHAGNIPNLREMHQGKTMRLPGENREIRCRWEKVGLSAHAPSSDLELFARDVTQGRDSAHIGLVHGQPEAQRDLAERLTGQLEHANVRSLRNGDPWVPGRS